MLSIPKTLFNSGTVLHYNTSLVALKRRTFPVEFEAPGIGNGYTFRRVKISDDGDYAFYNQTFGLTSITITRSDKSDTKTKTTIYRLKWEAAARPPVHPNPMIGTQSFDSISEARKFFKKRAPDSRFISLEKITTITEDVTSDFYEI